MDFVKIGGEYYRRGDKIEYIADHEGEKRQAVIHSFAWNEENISPVWPVLLLILSNGEEIKPYQIRKKVFEV